MSNAIKNSIIAKQLLTTLKDVAGQLKYITEVKQTPFQRLGYEVKIDESKITPEMLQKIDQTLVDICVELTNGITVEFPERTYEAVQPPLSFYPAAQQFFSGQNSLDPFAKFQPQQPFVGSRQQVTDPSSFNEEDRRLLMHVQEFVRNMHQQNQTFIDLYCQLLEKEPAYFVQGKCYKLLYRDITGMNIQQHRTYEIATDIRFFNHFNLLPITRLSIECVE